MCSFFLTSVSLINNIVLIDLSRVRNIEQKVLRSSLSLLFVFFLGVGEEFLNRDKQ